MANTYSAGIVTAYGAAVRGGYTGTYEEFCAQQAAFAENAEQVAEDRAAVEQIKTTFENQTVPAAVQQLTQAGAAQVQAVQAAGDAEERDIASAGAAQETRVLQAGADQEDAVNAAGSTQVQAVQTAGAAQVTAVQGEGSTQVAAVNAAGSAQVGAVEDKGEEVLASIPQDYSALSGEVDDLKSAVDSNFIPDQTIQKTIPASTSLNIPIYCSPDYVLSVIPDVISSNLRFSVFYADGTSITTKKFFAGGLLFRPEKELLYIRIINWETVEHSVTVTKKYSPQVITNYYDKSQKKAGFIENGTLYNGYYHSDFIPFYIGDTILAPGYPGTFGSRIWFHFYNQEEEYLGRAAGVLQENGLYQFHASISDIDVNFTFTSVAYMSFNLTVAGSETAVCYINKIPDTNLEYGQVQPDPSEFFNAQQKEYISGAGLSSLSGKKIAYDGDSIAESRTTSGNTYNGGSYPKIIADLTGGTFSNIAVGGGILASAVPSGTMPHSVVNSIGNMPDDADLICFEGGINDYWRAVPLGDYSESDYSSAVDTTTVCGALESIFRQATQKWVGKPICFVIVHKIKNTVYVANSAGWTFSQGREKMIGICKKYAIPFYDAFSESGLNAYNDIQNSTFLTSNSAGTADGCHPNEAGYKKYYVPQLIALFEAIMPRD